MFKVSSMTSNDLNSIKNILISDFDDFWDYNILNSELNCNSSKYIVIKTENNEIVGFSGLKIIVDEADIMNIVVKKSYRNLGLGSILLQNLINISKLQNLKSITFEVAENNLPAIHFYKKFMFKIVGIRPNYYNNETNAILMTKKL